MQDRDTRLETEQAGYFHRFFPAPLHTVHRPYTDLFPVWQNSEMATGIWRVGDRVGRTLTPNTPLPAPVSPVVTFGDN